MISSKRIPPTLRKRRAGPKESVTSRSGKPSPSTSAAATPVAAIPSDGDRASPTRSVTSVKQPVPSFSYRIDRRPSPTKRSSSPSRSKSRTATPEPGQIPAISRFVPGCGGSRRSAPRPSSFVAFRKSGEDCDRSVSTLQRWTSTCFGVVVTVAAAVRSTRDSSARKPPTVKITSPEVRSAPRTTS